MPFQSLYQRYEPRADRGGGPAGPQRDSNDGNQEAWFLKMGLQDIYVLALLKEKELQ